MKIFYWSPHISHVATVTAVINSIKSLQSYSLGTIECSLLDAVGEWEDYKPELIKNNINVKKLYLKEKYKKLPRYGFIKSRLAYWIIFCSSFFSLKKIINNNKPDYLIIHLITSLPILINYLFKLETKIILRVSGYPKLNILRWFVWKIMGTKIHKNFYPTVDTRKKKKKKKIFNKEKLFVLKDPIINISIINKKKNEAIHEIERLGIKKYLLSVGRITKQKNYFFLIDCFNDLIKLYPEYSLVIIGDGEDKNKLQEYINRKKLAKKAFLLPFKNNIFNYMGKAECFILSSLWEDPGWVLMEAASLNKIIISSNCPNGPTEFLSNGEGGYLFDSNKKDSFIKNFIEYENNSLDLKNKKILMTKKKVKEYTPFKHYQTLVEILKK